MKNRAASDEESTEGEGTRYPLGRLIREAVQRVRDLVDANRERHIRTWGHRPVIQPQVVKPYPTVRVGGKTFTAPNRRVRRRQLSRNRPSTVQGRAVYPVNLRGPVGDKRTTGRQETPSQRRKRKRHRQRANAAVPPTACVNPTGQE